MFGRTHADKPGLVKLIEKQMRRWEITRGLRPARPTPLREQVANFVAISNDVGAGGDEIAVILAGRLNWPVFDKQILHTMADDNAMRERLHKSMNERDLSWLGEMIRSLIQQEFRKNDPFHRLAETVLCIARQGNAIFLGRAVDLILPRTRGLRVKLVASRHWRVENFARRTGANPGQAAVEIDRIEQERRRFVQEHFRVDPDDSTRFELLINVSNFNFEQVVDLIEAALKMR
ncbi:MAG: cytidylate kinase-like family protein [Phycisphaerae bacterium]|nr:cytidylate kinase-like family protein [Phycisphaerae bacterium]